MQQTQAPVSGWQEAPGQCEQERRGCAAPKKGQVHTCPQLLRQGNSAMRVRASVLWHQRAQPNCLFALTISAGSTPQPLPLARCCRRRRPHGVHPGGKGRAPPAPSAGACASARAPRHARTTPGCGKCKGVASIRVAKGSNTLGREQAPLRHKLAVVALAARCTNDCAHPHSGLCGSSSDLLAAVPEAGASGAAGGVGRLLDPVVICVRKMLLFVCAGRVIEPKFAGPLYRPASATFPFALTPMPKATMKLQSQEERSE